MLLLYADDEKIPRELVKKVFTARGHHVIDVDTSSPAAVKDTLRELRDRYGIPDIIILDGHNILLDEDGSPLFDMTPLGLVNWLHQNGIPPEVKFILYSN